jgi:predicted esterase
MIPIRGCILYVALGALALSSVLAAQEGGEDVADIPSQDLQAGKHAKMRYFLIGPYAESEMPEKGFGLLSADFHPFVKRIFKYALPDNYLVAQPVAVQWSPKQEITWPTKKKQTSGQKFTTEEFIDAVIKDASAKQKINPDRVFTLSWSSGGPAAYACSLSSKKIKGSFVAMSIFKPKDLPPLDNAKGRSYYIYHSIQDRVCPMFFARQAVKDLKKHDAQVKLFTYHGGHGWKPGLYEDIRAGIEWLESDKK